MYISVKQALELDKIVKSNEVALRSYIADVLSQIYDKPSGFKSSLESISISGEVIYAQKFKAKLKMFISKSAELFGIIEKCKQSLDTKKYDNDVPYVS